MALSANSANVQILKDTHSSLVVKCLLFQNTAGDESSVLKVNVNSLIGRTMTLVGTLARPTDPVSLIPGETVTAQDGVVGYVGQVWSPNATHIVTTVILANSASPFANSDVVTGERSNNALTLAATNGAVSDLAILSLTGAWWSVHGNSSVASSVAVEFDNANTNHTEEAIRVSGTGWFSKNNLPGGPIKTTMSANGATGNIDVSTYNTPAKGGYTLVLEFQKERGFGQRPIH